MRNLWVVALLLVSTASWGGAQSGGVKRGDRIRFSIGAPDSLHVAVLDRLTSDSLFLKSCPTCDRLLYSRAEAGRLAVFRKSGGGMRAISGFGIGGLVGLVVAGLAAANCHGGDRCDGGIVAIPFIGLAGGLVGAIGGYLSGYKWQPIT
jgi:hypothetical protein